MCIEDDRKRGHKGGSRDIYGRADSLDRQERQSYELGQGAYEIRPIVHMYLHPGFLCSFPPAPFK